jgi:peptide chain release factor subunit 1
MATTITRDHLRRLAQIKPERGRVLSVILNLDPAEFATPPARSTAVTSVLTKAAHRIEEADGLDHDERSALREDVERVREALMASDLAQNGTRAVAVYACKPADLLEVVRITRPVESTVVLDRSPYLEPLVAEAHEERWCVLLANRRNARFFIGDGGSLEETDRVEDDVHSQHDQGGWSQARYQRGVEKEKDDHLRHTAEALMKHFKRQPFQRLVVGGPREVVADFESKLHGYLLERLAGRIEVDVDNSTPDQVLAAAQPRFDELEDRREAEVLDRLGEGGRAASGLDDVLRALNERRVETLVLDEQFSAEGTCCPQCGWLGPQGERTCPVDGTPLEHLEELADAAIELTLQQSAEILAIRRRRDEFEERAGGIAALLRF